METSAEYIRLRSRPAARAGIVAALAFSVTPGMALAQRYSITVLPVPEGHSSAFPAWHSSINESGDICGTAFNNVELTPVVWRGNQLFELPFLSEEPPYPPNAFAHSINNNGVVVGQDFTGRYAQQAVMWPDEHTVIPIIDGDSSATGVNDNLVVVGQTTVGWLDVEGFMWEGGKWWSIAPIEFSGSVNNLDQTVGGTNFRSWLWDHGQVSELPKLNPDDQSVGFGRINDMGLITGAVHGADGRSRPVIWTNLIPRELPLPGLGLSGSIGPINCNGEAVGGFEDHQFQWVGALWHHNLVTELTDLAIGPYARPMSISPRGINNHRQIAAIVQYEGQWGYAAARLEPLDTGLTVWGIEPARPGQRNVIRVNHGTPGGRVSLLWGEERGEPQPLEQCQGAMTEIVNPRVAATAVAGADGMATFHLSIPANVQGLYVLQAVDQRTCEVSPPAWTLLKMEN